MNELDRDAPITPVSENRWKPEPQRYCLRDQAGNPIGTIAAPVERPRLGTSAPTVYLRRDGYPARSSK
jgi:hypothetical protein